MVKNGVSVQTRLAKGLPLIQGDRVQLQQVILNLIVNAVDAMSGVSEGARELFVGTADDAQNGVLIEVRDSGPGLPPESLDRVFDAYFRPAAGRAQTDLLVCHGNVIRYLVTRALGVDTAAWLEMSVGHASITHIRVEADGRYKVISIGDVGHLPPALRSGASGDPKRSLAIPALP